MRRIVPIALIAGFITALAPPVAAFHGTAYVLDGTAIFGPTDQLWNARYEWSGNLGQGGSFRITLVDPVSGAALPAVTVKGAEGLNGVQFPLNIANQCGAFEIVADYTGYDTQTGGKMVSVEGIQENCLGAPRNGDRYMEVVGKFMQHWSLDLEFGTIFNTGWEQEYQ